MIHFVTSLDTITNNSFVHIITVTSKVEHYSCKLDYKSGHIK